MKLYHVARKDIYDRYISKEGLKPICDIERKSYPDCEEAIFFHDNLKDANYEGKVYADSGKPWIMLEVDLDDIVSQCKCLSKDNRHPKGSYYATSRIYNGHKKDEAKFYPNFLCVIKPDKLKVIHSSIRQQNTYLKLET
jgi:hypothetical protein